MLAGRGADVKRWVRLRGALVAGAAATLMLGGCAATGLFHDVPAETAPQPAYPNIAAVPPERGAPTMSAEQQAQTEQELKALAASRHKAMEHRLKTEQ